MKKNLIINNLGINFDGPILFRPKAFEDERGFFQESWNQKIFTKLINCDVTFVQDNYSRSCKNVLRGMHYQIYPYPQSKLVRCTRGRILDVIVDMRKSSKTFGTWGSIELSEKNLIQLWIPKGFAHGFLALEEINDVMYKTDYFWDPNCERTLTWNDKSLGIEWNLKNKDIKISKKDQNSLNFNQIDKEDMIF